MHEAADREQLLVRPGRVRLFSGSGTTIIAAEMTGRACYAMESLEQYVDVAVERWHAFTGETAHLKADGRTFTAVASERRPALQDA
jgi:hypothetical protein